MRELKKQSTFVNTYMTVAEGNNRSVLGKSSWAIDICILMEETDSEEHFM
jgi:hypothetical protein